MTPAPSPLLQTLTRFRSEVDKRDAATLKQLSGAYSKLFKRLQNEVELEARRIFEQDSVSRAYISKRLAALTEQVEDELRKYSQFLETTIGTTTDEALTLGSKHAVELMKMATLGQKDIIGIDFNKLPVSAINTMMGFLSPNSTLFERIGQLAKYHAPIVRDKLVEGIALGFNPYKTAGNIAPYLRDIDNTFQIAMASPFADAVRMARTATLYSYREAARANYKANDDVVTGWQWFAELDDVTCMSCVAMHGTIHDLDETLDDHYNGRCSQIPVVLGQPLISETAGTDWFGNQDEATQRSMMGPGAFDAWQNGQFDLSQMSTERDDDVYGTMRGVTSLQDLLAGDTTETVSAPANFDKLAEFEQNIAGQSYESAGVYSSSGELLFMQDGETSNVFFTDEQLQQMNGAVVTHNHPGGSPFSFDDLSLFANRDLAELRAVGSEYTYIIRNVGGEHIGNMGALYDNAMYQAAVKYYKDGLSDNEMLHRALEELGQTPGLEYERRNTNA